ncbi:hypothetical protein LB543_17670 [Mesorhizobium sp. ESP7-2]|uniref:hypothetical protein n=1 Tax=Mesorhizobium sp. ESP7-2 TaxID=2876622 RepID=UPI001CCF95D0|nr:hypothetical protein [Mesorhizobium sp. ESP7-2]MBZ9708550.1 hypothetical protein [Mesorhizobium sp. ESP7-2]
MQQPQGRDYQGFHERALPWIGGIAILGIVVVLGLFYFVRGRIRTAAGESGVRILRFNASERLAHLDDCHSLHHPGYYRSESRIRETSVDAADRTGRVLDVVILGEIRAWLRRVGVHAGGARHAGHMALG